MAGKLVFRLVYGLAIRLRAAVWRVQRPRLVGVRALIVEEGQVLLVRHRAGVDPWALPGGGVARFERLSEAARREAQEETGAPVRVERLLGLYDNFRGGVSNYIAVFICTPVAAMQPNWSLEIAEARYFPFDQLPPGLDLGSRRRIQEYCAGKSGITALW